jgi:recombination protein RecR
MARSKALAALIDALGELPGVGVKSASRMAHHLLSRDRAAAARLSQALAHAVANVGQCRRCNTLCEGEVCDTCSDTRRDPTRLCVVETPADQDALERTRVYHGLYFVLMGRLSPLDGVGAKEVGIQALFERIFGEDGQAQVQELLIATNFTAEGEATAHVVAQALKGSGVRVTRLAKGVPAGSELEYVDLSTLAHAVVDRRGRESA